MRSLLLCTTAAIALGSSVNAFAQASSAVNEQESSAGDEIVVTAQRRSEALEQVPMAVSVVTGDALEKAGVTSISDIGRVATGVQFNFAGAVPVVAIRGISSLVTGNNVEPNVAIYVDGFYNANPAAIASDLANLESIEVLKGPQGTLYGRNATGGAVLINTRGPSKTWTGRVDASYGSFNETNLNGFVAGPLSDRIRFSVGLHNRRSDGYIKLVDPTTIGKTVGDAAPFREFSARAKLQVDLTDKLTATLGYNYTNFDDPRIELFSQFAHVNSAAGIPAPPGRPTKFGQAAYNYETHHRVKSHEGTLKLSYETGIGTINSYTGYAKRRSRQAFDFDGSYADLTYTTTSWREKSFQQTVDYNVNAIKGVDLVLGGFYYYDHFGTADPDGTVSYRPGLVVAQTSHAQQYTRAWAVYADATWHITDQFSLAAGGRYSHDWKRMTFNAQLPTGAFSVAPIEDAKSWNAFTPRVTARYEIAPRTNIWASWSRGFRSGTYNFAGPTVLGLLPVDPETADAFELGFKTAQRRLRFSTSAYYYDYRSIQTSVTIPNPICPPNTVCSPLITLQNAKGATVYGVEGEVTWQPVDQLSLHSGVVWSHGRYKSFPNAIGTGVNATNTLNVTNQKQDWTGKMMVRAPNWSGNVSADYEQPVSFGTIRISANLNFTSSFPLQNASLYGPLAPPELRDKQRLRQKGYALLSAQLGWTDPSDHFSVTVYGNNLTDHTYFLFYNAGVFGDYSPTATPREYGIRAGYKF